MKTKPLRIYLEHFICAWVDLAVAIVWVMTLGLYRPNWDFDAIAFFRRRELHKKLKEQG